MSIAPVVDTDAMRRLYIETRMRDLLSGVEGISHLLTKIFTDAQFDHLRLGYIGAIVLLRQRYGSPQHHLGDDSLSVILAAAAKKVAEIDWLALQ